MKERYMIGNYVNYSQGTICEVRGFNPDYDTFTLKILKTGEKIPSRYKHIQPIPLNENELVKLGFEIIKNSIQDYYEKGKIAIFIEPELISVNLDGLIIKRPQIFVHELQQMASVLFKTTLHYTPSKP